MTTFGDPGGLSSSPGDTHEYALWDAAYVLGSLSCVGAARIRGTPKHLPVVP